MHKVLLFLVIALVSQVSFAENYKFDLYEKKEEVLPIDFTVIKKYQLKTFLSQSQDYKEDEKQRYQSIVEENINSLSTEFNNGTALIGLVLTEDEQLAGVTWIRKMPNYTEICQTNASTGDVYYFIVENIFKKFSNLQELYAVGPRSRQVIKNLIDRGAEIIPHYDEKYKALSKEFVAIRILRQVFIKEIESNILDTFSN